MIKLFNIPKYKIPSFSGNILSDGVEEFENKFAQYVGAKYACGVNSATNAIFLSLYNKNATLSIPSIIPPVVPNAIIQSGCNFTFNDDTDWVGSSYVLHDFGDYKIIDSAQECFYNQFLTSASYDDIMIFSFYPTKPVSGIDGGMIVSNDRYKIEWFKSAVNNGMGAGDNSWDKTILFPGWKMYLSASQAFVANKGLDALSKKQVKIMKNRILLNDMLDTNNNSLHLFRVNSLNMQALKSDLIKNKISFGHHYAPLHEHAVYKKYAIDGMDYTRSEQDGKTTISIPFHEKVSEKNIRKIGKICLNYV